MKLYYAKHEQNCRGCPMKIQRGELCVRTFYSTQGAKFIRPYHFECYKSYWNNKFDRDCLQYMKQLKPVKALGRPRKYKDGKEIHKIKTLITYHKKQGHGEKVLELEKKLGELMWVQM